MNILVAHPIGIHYHTNDKCSFIKYETEEYVEISINDIRERDLFECPRCWSNKKGLNYG